MAKTHIIIGSSAAGISAVNVLRQLDPESTIICISDEKEWPYNKCHLADYVAGLKTEEQVHTYTPERSAQKNIQFLLGTVVIALRSQQRLVILADGQHLAYDTLLIATGTSPVIPSIKGIENVDGIVTFHSMRDANTLLTLIKHNKPHNVVVIGAGLSGLECADALINKVPSITVIERANQILPSLVPDSAAAPIEYALKKAGVNLHKSDTVTSITSGHGKVTGVQLASGLFLPADIVVCAVGVRPNNRLAADAGINLEQHSIVVNDHMQTSIPDVYAAGDIVLVKDQITGQLVPSRTWPDAMLQGLVAAHTMAGKQRAYPGVAVITSSAFFGLKFASCGLLEGAAGNQQVILDNSQGSYHRYVLEGSCLKGFVVVAETLNVGALKRAVLTRQTLTPQELLQGL